MSKCTEYVAMMGAYLEGELSAEDRALLEEHLLSCPECRQHLEGLKKFIEVLSELEDEPPAGLAESIIEKIRLEKKNRGILTLLRRHTFPVVAAAAAVFVLVVTGVYQNWLPRMGNSTASPMLASADMAAPEAYGGSSTGEAPAAGEENAAMTKRAPLDDSSDEAGGNDADARGGGNMMYSMQADMVPLALPALPFSQSFAFILVIESKAVPEAMSSADTKYEIQNFEDYDVVFLPAADLDLILAQLEEGGLRYTNYDDPELTPQVNPALDIGLAVIVRPAE